MDNETNVDQPIHTCPICGKEIPITEACCPDCEFLYYNLMGIL